MINFLKYCFSRRNKMLLLLFPLVFLSANAEDQGSVDYDIPERDFKVRGYGLFGNRTLSRIVPLLATGEDMRESVFSHAFLENLLLLVHARVESDGYLSPMYEIQLQGLQGQSTALQWDGRGWLQIPVHWEPQRVDLRIHRGKFHYYGDIEVEGLKAMDLNDATSYFYPGGFVFQTKGYRPFSPAALRTSRSHLLDELQQRGYRRAKLLESEYFIDEDSGEVDVLLRIDEGRLHRVRGLEVRMKNGDVPEEVDIGRTEFKDQLLSADWQRQQVRRVINRFYAAGYPDVASRTRVKIVEERVDDLICELIIEVDPGPRLRLGGLRFEGHGRTREGLLNRKMLIREGDWFNPLLLEESRSGIGKLGIFSRSRVVTDDEDLDADPGQRSVVMRFEENDRLSLSLLLGYSTYEMVRGGFEVERANLWGRAHRDRLRLVQSFKSSNVQYTYTMPEFFGEDLSFAVEGHALLRDEISFRREEWGSEVRLTKEFGSRTQASVGYRLEKLDSRRFLLASDSPTRVESRVGSLQLSFSRDTRDNPLYPSSGTQFRSDVELGSQFIGADVTYQRFNFQFSYHRTLRPGLRVHGRIAHGFATTWGSDPEDLPLNRRFYPGGVNSIRGYRSGAASPVDSAGQYIGAESYILTQAEIEQDLSPSLSGVLFIDHLFFARRISDYPGEESLLTLGTGLRYRTIVGPLRVEVGWNIERREIDPTYKIQLSLGFPF